MSAGGTLRWLESQPQHRGDPSGSHNHSGAPAWELAAIGCAWTARAARGFHGPLARGDKILACHCSNDGSDANPNRPFLPKSPGAAPRPVQAIAQSDTLLRLEEFPGAVLVFPLSCCLSHTSPLQLSLRLLSLPAFLPLWQVEKTDRACRPREGCGRHGLVSGLGHTGERLRGYPGEGFGRQGRGGMGNALGGSPRWLQAGFVLLPNVR